MDQPKPSPLDALRRAAEHEDFAERTIIHEGRSPDRRGSTRQEWAHFLAFHDATVSGSLQHLPLGTAPVRIGRRAPCEIVLVDGEVSGVHCELRVQGQDVYVTDLGSTNGTFVNGRRAAPRLRVPVGASLQVGRQFLKLETRDRAEFAESLQLHRDLGRARHYVRSLLPPPLLDGPVRVEWFFEPSGQVGGDGFGYYALDAHHVVGYIIDVAGHGVGAAMHLVTVMNTLRQRALPDTDLADPAQVLSRLNTMFQMDGHDNMLFSIWYGVLDLQTRHLTFASAGHHPAYLRPAAGGPLRPLHTPHPIVGALASVAFAAGSVPVSPGDKLYLFSDGAFEINPVEGQDWGLERFTRLLGAAAGVGAEAVPEPEQLFRQLRRVARPGPLDDDVSILVATLT